jgi:hypothetical protein
MRIPPLKKGPPHMRRRWRVTCDCGSPVFTTFEYYLTRTGNPKRDCGCGRKTIKTTHNQEYRIWLMMHKRTEDPNHVSYGRYGGRGIKVCQEWHRSAGDGKGFDRFLEFIGSRPSPNHTIDRINNDVGYQPYWTDPATGQTHRQVRWATASEQRANQGSAPQTAPAIDPLAEEQTVVVPEVQDE